MLGAIVTLLSKDLRLEWRVAKNTGALVLFVLTTLFVIYSVRAEWGGDTWMTLYWIIFLFSCSTASSRHFQELSGRSGLYYYHLYPAIAYLLAKMIFLSMLLMLIGAILWWGMVMISGLQIHHHQNMWICIAAGSLSLSISFNFISAIANFSGNRNAFLIPLLAFPVVLPQVILLILSSKTAVSELAPIEFLE